MEVTPQSVRTTAFKTVKKGYDPDEVDTFKSRVAGAIESAQNQATAMEARARAAVAKLQELSQQSSASEPASGREGAGASSGDTITVRPTDAENISRTLLLAQRTADATIADARTEASQIVDTARSTSAQIIEDARAEGRRGSEEERLRAEGEVQSLLARRDFLSSDVDHLEQHLASQRERLRDAAVALHDLVDRVPGGLGEMRRPLLSASDGEAPTAAGSLPVEADPTSALAAEAPSGADAGAAGNPE